MGPTKLITLAAFLWGGSSAMRVRKESSMMEKLVSLAKEAEAILNEDEKVAVEENSTKAARYTRKKEKGVSASGDRRRRRLFGFLENPFGGSSTSQQFQVLRDDRNPIGKGNIPAAYGLLTIIFGKLIGFGSDDEGNHEIQIADLRRILLDRQFPTSYKFPGRLQSRSGRPPLSAKLNSMGGRFSTRRGARPFEFETAPFVPADLKNVNFIICPFLSTMMWEGGIELKQVHTRRELMRATIVAGLDEENAEEHVADNFANNPTGTIDLWNMEGAMNEHVSSTGINDCVTSFTRCRFIESRETEDPYTCGYVCDATSDRQCPLPNPLRFNQFISVADVNGNGKIAMNELFVVADRGCQDGIECSSGGTDEFDDCETD